MPLPVWYSYLSVLPHDNADIFASSLLISYSIFPFLILLSVVMIAFCMVSKRLCPKLRVLSDARVGSLTRKEYGLAVHFCLKLHKIIKVNIRRIIGCSFLKFLFVWEF